MCMNKNENKNIMKAKISLLISFAAASAKLKEQIVDSFGDSINDQVFDLLDRIQSNETSNIDAIMEELEPYFSDENEEGQPVAIPYISYGDYMYSIETGVKYPDGERLVAYLSESDYNTIQTGTMFYTANNNPIDLTMAEIKKGELAKIYYLPEDNKDIDIYVWADETSEDITHNFRLNHSSILESFGEKQELGDDNE